MEQLFSIYFLQKVAFLRHIQLSSRKYIRKRQPKQWNYHKELLVPSNFSRWNLINASLWDKSREKSCIGTAGLFYKSCSQLFGELKNYTLTRLLSGSGARGSGNLWPAWTGVERRTTRRKAFLRNYGKQKSPTNTSPKTVSIPTLTFDTIPIKIVLMKIATEIW